MNNVIIFLGNQPYSEEIFKIQRRVIRIIIDSRTKDSRRQLFETLEVLLLYSQYIFFSNNICDKKQTFILHK